MRVLGISAFGQESAAVLVEDGHLIAAVQEERLTRRKHDAAFPLRAASFCLERAGCGLAAVDRIAFYDKALWHEGAFLDGCAALGGLCDPLARLSLVERQRAHAASAFYPSPFERAAFLTFDGAREGASAALGRGEDGGIEILEELCAPHALGQLYTALTAYLGFKPCSGEYKVMGLAAYGQPRFADEIAQNLIELRADGTFRLNEAYFGADGFSLPRLAALFGQEVRGAEAPLTSFHKDMAASLQKVSEEATLRLIRRLAALTGERFLCLAGEMALNCVANGRILRESGFEALWVQPASGDAGGALGAALAVSSRRRGAAERAGGADGEDGKDGMCGAYLGPSFTHEEVLEQLQACGARFSLLPQGGGSERAAQDLAEGKIVGWMQGRMEFGPRALGARSILADPRRAEMRERLNGAVKFRESFRPFAPSVLQEEAARWFVLDGASPYMLLTAQVRGERLPAVTHRDGSARVQTVSASFSPAYHTLLARFFDLTGCPVLLNTSFNVRGEPIVCTPEDAFRCFMGCGLDALVIGDVYLEKSAQNPALVAQSRMAFPPD